MQQTQRMIGILCWISMIGGLCFSQTSSQEVIFEHQEYGIRIIKEQSLPGFVKFHPHRSLEHTTGNISQESIIRRVMTETSVFIEREDGEVLFERQIKWPSQDRIYESKNGAFWGILHRDSRADKYSSLTLLDQTGRILWEQDEVPDSALWIANDGSTVVAIHLPTGFDELDVQYTEMKTYDQTGQLLTHRDEIQCGWDMSPDGTFLFGLQGGTEWQGGVSINDRFIGCNNLGQPIWEVEATGLHVTSRFAITNENLITSCYTNGGRNQYILVISKQGELRFQLESEIDNRGSYKFTVAPDGQHIMAFGRQHLVFLNANEGSILWEWENDAPDQEWIFKDAVITEDMQYILTVVSVAYQARELLIFNKRGKLLVREQWPSTAMYGENLQLQTAGSYVYLTDKHIGDVYLIQFQNQ